MAWPCDSLLDDFTTKVCIDQAFVSAIRGIPQIRIRDFFPFCEALKPPGLEDPHRLPGFIL
ncbi:MAG TPA: hypothetical protein VMB49_00665 [Acidobacteriaceae bacterium]|nr:hypothetical protein [Acidobacteriaceae bacterium]